LASASPDGERGSVTVETVLIFPVLLVMLMLVVQFALAAHADHTVTAAAQEASVAAQREGGTDEDAVAAATEVIGNADLLREVDITVASDPDSVEVTVRAKVDSVVPGFPAMNVTGKSAGPRERFRP
jgi:Flp pilus assembly protein TadG